MKHFAQRRMHLAGLSLSARLVYTFFLLFIGVGLWTSVDLYVERVGTDLDGPAGTASVRGRYVGHPRQAAAPTGGGPTLDLGDEASWEPTEGGSAVAHGGELPTDDRTEREAKRPWVMDVFHQHIFSVSVVFLILAHLFMLTRMHPMVITVVVSVAGLSSLLHVIAPVLIWRTGGLLWLMPVSGAAMGLSWTWMVLWSLLAMWTSVGRGAPRREPDPHL